MAQDPLHPSPQRSVVLARDYELVQRLTDARRLAEGRDDDAAWRELAGRIDRILDAIGVEDLDPQTAPAMTEDEDAPAVGQGTVATAAASLSALLELPDEDQLALANEAVRDLETGLETGLG